MFRATGPQDFEFTGVGRLRIVQRPLRLRANRVPFGYGGLGLTERRVSPGSGLSEFSHHHSESRLLIVELSAKGANFSLKFRIGSLEGGDARGRDRCFRFEFFAALRKDLFALLDRERPH